MRKKRYFDLKLASGREGIHWNEIFTTPPGRVCSENISRCAPGVKGFAQARQGTVLDPWHENFDEKMLRQNCKSSYDYAASTGDTEFYLSASELENFVFLLR